MTERTRRRIASAALAIGLLPAIVSGARPAAGPGFVPAERPSPLESSPGLLPATIELELELAGFTSRSVVLPPGLDAKISRWEYSAKREAGGEAGQLEPGPPPRSRIERLIDEYRRRRFLGSAGSMERTTTARNLAEARPEPAPAFAATLEIARFPSRRRARSCWSARHPGEESQALDGRRVFASRHDSPVEIRLEFLSGRHILLFTAASEEPGLLLELARAFFRAHGETLERSRSREGERASGRDARASRARSSEKARSRDSQAGSSGGSERRAGPAPRDSGSEDRRGRRHVRRIAVEARVPARSGEDNPLPRGRRVASDGTSVRGHEAGTIAPLPPFVRSRSKVASRSASAGEPGPPPPRSAATPARPAATPPTPVLPGVPVLVPALPVADPPTPSASSAAPNRARARVLYESGRQYLGMERAEEACSRFVAALASDPGLSEARERIVEIERRFGVVPRSHVAPPEPVRPSTAAPVEDRPFRAPVRPAALDPRELLVPAESPPESSRTAAIAVRPSASSGQTRGSSAPISPPGWDPAGAGRTAEISAAALPFRPLTAPTTRRSRAEGPGFNNSGSAAALTRLPHDESAGAAGEPPPEARPPTIGRRGWAGMLPLVMGGVFACLMFVLLKKQLRV